MNLSDNIELVTKKLSSWGTEFFAMLPNFTLAIIVVVIFGLLSKTARKWSRKPLARLSDQQEINSIIATAIGLFVMMLGVILSLNILQLEKTVMSLLAGAGVVGLALGFAFQDIAANFMAGMFLLIRKPLSVGDIVKTNDFVGVVQTLDMRNTIIQTWEGHTVFIPNKEVFEKPLVNLSTNGQRRVDFEVGVSYKSDLDHSEKIAIQALESLENRDLNKDVEVFYTEFGNSSILMSLRVWLVFPKEHSWLKTRHLAIKAIKKAFDVEGISIPFPIRTLELDKTITTGLENVLTRESSSSTGEPLPDQN